MPQLALDSWIVNHPTRNLAIVPNSGSEPNASFATWMDGELAKPHPLAPSAILRSFTTASPDLAILVADGRQDHSGKFVLVLFSLVTSEENSVPPAKWISGQSSLSPWKPNPRSSKSPKQGGKKQDNNDWRAVVAKRKNHLSAIVRVHLILPRPVCGCVYQLCYQVDSF